MTLSDRRKPEPNAYRSDKPVLRLGRNLAEVCASHAMLMGRMTLRMSPGARVERGSIPRICRHSPRGITRGARAYRMTDAQPFGIPRGRKPGVGNLVDTSVRFSVTSNLSDGITVPFAY